MWQQREWSDRNGKTAAIGLDDILIITPYNAQVFEIQRRLPGARVGTANKFQGQEAPIAMSGNKPWRARGRPCLRVEDREIRDLWAALDKAEQEKVRDIPPVFCRFVRTLLLTGLRRTLAARAEWREIDYLQRDVLTSKAKAALDKR
jgi:integrase